MKENAIAFAEYLAREFIPWNDEATAHKPICINPATPKEGFTTAQLYDLWIKKKPA